MQACASPKFSTVGKMKQPSKPNTICPMAFNVSANKNCANAAHVAACFTRMLEEVQSLINELTAEVYCKDKQQQTQMVYNELTSFSEQKLGHMNDGLTRATSPKNADGGHDGVVLTTRDDRTAGVSLVEIEKYEVAKGPFDGLTSESPNDDKNGNNRIGQNLHDTQQFVSELAVPQPARERSNSRNS